MHPSRKAPSPVRSSPEPSPAHPRALDITAIQADFPALGETIHDHPLVYLDSAATALTPQVVIDAIIRVYHHAGGNVHRGVHTLSQRATEAYEAARATVARFLHASGADEIVFVRGTTEAINLVAHGWASGQLQPGDRVVVSELEHHSNLVPWQRVCRERGAELVAIPMTPGHTLDLDAAARLIDDRARIVAISHVSNVLGTVVPVRALVQLAVERGAHVVVDGAQAAPHIPVNVQELGCDFYAVSGHKLYGPTGVGALWARRELLDAMAPYQVGGGMIREVAIAESSYREAPYRFEAGTPNIAGAVGLAAAVNYLEALGLDAIASHEREVADHATRALAAAGIPGLRYLRPEAESLGVFSFTLDGVHPHDIGTVLDARGIAIRTGHHCAQPLMKRLGVPATARASLGLHNTRDDIDALLAGLREVDAMFRPSSRSSSHAEPPGQSAERTRS